MGGGNLEEGKRGLTPSPPVRRSLGEGGSPSPNPNPSFRTQRSPTLVIPEISSPGAGLSGIQPETLISLKAAYFTTENSENTLRQAPLDKLGAGRAG